MVENTKRAGFTTKKLAPKQNKNFHKRGNSLNMKKTKPQQIEKGEIKTFEHGSKKMAIY